MIAALRKKKLSIWGRIGAFVCTSKAFNPHWFQLVKGARKLFKFFKELDLRLEDASTYCICDVLSYMISASRGLAAL